MAATAVGPSTGSADAQSTANQRAQNNNQGISSFDRTLPFFLCPLSLRLFVSALCLAQQSAVNTKPPCSTLLNQGVSF